MKRVFRLPSTRNRIADEVDDELRFHLEGRIEDLIAREGLSREAAEREARRRFGNYETYRREAHAIDEHMIQRRNSMDLVDAIRRETRNAFRSLRRSPSFSIIAIITLGLGLGASTTIFTLLDRVVLRPLPYPEASRLVNIATAWPKTKAGLEYGISRGQYFYFKKNSRALQNVLFYDTGMMVIAGDGAHPPEQTPEAATSASTFGMLGFTPELGRLFVEEDERLPRAAIHPAVLSHEYWQRRFGGDSSIIGRQIETDETPIRVIGVLAPGAALPQVKTDIWMPNHLDPADPPVNNHTHNAIGLLAPNATVASAQTELAAIQARLQTEFPAAYPQAFLDRSGFRIHVTSLADSVVGATIVRALWLVFAAVAFVLLIAAANVANLFLVRIDARRREVALRRALGADVSHLAVHYVSESMALSLLAAIAALALGYALLHVVLAIAPQSLPRLAEVGFDWRSVAFCVTAAALFGAAFGLLPLGSASADASMLRDGARGITTSKARDFARGGLVLAQMALAVVLLTGAGLMVRTFARLRAVQPGFDPRGVHTMDILIPQTYDAPGKAPAFWRELTTRLEATPGIVRAGATAQLPLDGGDGCNGVVFDVVNAAGESAQCMPFNLVTPGYFEAMGIHGRGSLPAWSTVDAQTGPLVVTKSFANRVWGSADAIGHGIQPFNKQFPFFPVVAVIDDIRDAGFSAAPRQMAYFPITAPAGAPQWRIGNGLVLVVKAPALSSSVVTDRVRSILSQIEPKAIIASPRPMEMIVAQSMAQTSFTMLLLLIAATIALALSAVGIYGVISYLVSQRRSEIGVRMALGAQSREVVRLIVGRSIALAASGVIVGVVAALASTRLLRSLLYEVSPTDPLVLAATVIALLAVAVLASAAPARRAARIDPVEAMRAS